jgi:hypothetical protein
MVEELRSSPLPSPMTFEKGDFSNPSASSLRDEAFFSSWF